MSNKKLKLIINTIGIIIIIASLFYFLEKDLVISNSLELKSNFSKKQAMFSVIYPEHRVIKTENGMRVDQVPIYFDVRCPIKFDKAELLINLENKSNANMTLNLKVGEGDWSFETYKLESDKIILIDLKNAKIESGNLKFMISTDDLNKLEYKPVIKSINAKLFLSSNRSRMEAYKEFINNTFTHIKTFSEKLRNKIIS